MIYGVVASEYRFAIPAPIVPLGTFDFVNGIYNWQGTTLTAAETVADDEWIGADGLAITGSPAVGTSIIYSGMTTVLATCSWTVVLEVDLPVAQSSPLSNFILVITNAGTSYFIEIYYKSGWQSDSYDPTASAYADDFVNSLSAGIHKIAVTRTNSNLAVSVDGNAVNSDTTATSLPVIGFPMTNFYLGNWPSPDANGRAVNIRSISVYDVQADSDLASLSGGGTPPLPNLGGSGVFAGSGNLVANAEISTPGLITGSASFGGAGALSSLSNLNLSGMSSLAGIGAMSAAGSIQSPSALTGSAAFAGSGSLTANGTISAAATMPSYVNTGSITGSAGSTTAYVNAMMGGRVNGNLLVAFIQLQGAASKSLSVDGTWQIQDTLSDANGTSAWACCYVTGSEAIPTFSWDGSTQAWHGQIFQFQDVHSVDPIGDIASNSGSGTTLSVSAVTTTAAQSLVLGILLSDGNQVIPLPSGYSNIAQFNDQYGDDRIVSEGIATSGTDSDAVSVTISSGKWHGYLLELLAA